ncbi:MAG TPA: Mur ligase family protein [Duganella sp.]|jgi:cyanophycin synthetase
MKIVEQHVLRGANLYSSHPCVLTVIDLQDLRGAVTSKLDGFNQRLLALLPSLRGQAGQDGGFVKALDDGANLAHVVEHITVALQCLAGTPVSVSRTQAMAGGGQYGMVCAYQIEQVAVDAVDLALVLVRGLLAQPGPDADVNASAEGNADADANADAESVRARLAEGLAALRETAQRRAIGTSTGAIIDAATQQGIPSSRLTPEANLFVLGWGARQKRLQASITGDTGHIAVGIASDKALTKTLLQEAGVPVPEGMTARSLEQAQRAARQLGGLVTVKPLDGNHGRGVTTRCGTDDEVALAFERAREHGRTIIIERYIQGDDYRVLVAGNQVVAAALRRPASVTGDGVASVRELVGLENQNPARGEGHSNILTRIPLDGQAETTLAKQGLQLDSVPANGQRVLLRGNANLSSGGTAEDVTDRLPPHTRAMCVRAVRKIGLDVAGIDLVCEDIGVPLDGKNGAVIEINAAPGIRMHVYPSAGTPRDAGAAIVASMFGDGNGRVPLIAVTGTNGHNSTTATRIIEHTLRQAGIGTGCANGDGVFINGHSVIQSDCDSYRAARTVLGSPDVEFAVLETARDGILQQGLAFDRCDVAVVLDVGNESLGMDSAETLDALARVHAVTAQAAADALVLNAGDPRCVAIGANAAPQVEVIYFGADAGHPALVRHLARGGRAAWLEDGAIMLADGKSPQRLAGLEDLPARLDSGGRDNTVNALAAAAALMASELNASAIADGLRSFMMAGAAAAVDSPVVDRAQSLDQVAQPVGLGNQFECV